MIVSSLGFFLITLDILIVNVALTRIEAELGGGTVAQQWVIDGYTLFFGALLLLAGNVSERWGAKRALVVGTALFATTSLACGLAPSIGVLVAARCGQGVAAALMLPASMALIREQFPEAAPRARALGIWAVGGAVAAAAGPLLGGLLTTLDWRWVFHVNVPVGLGMLAILRAVGPSSHRSAPFDWYGQALSLVGLSGLVYGLIRGGAAGVADPSVIASLVVAAVALAAFFVVEARREHPMVPLGLFRPADLRISLAAGFAFMVSWYGTVFIASLYLQQHLGLSPLLAGLAFLPSALVSVLGNLASGPLTNRFGARLPVLTGFAGMVVGLVGLILTAPLGSPWLTSVLIVPIGAGGSVAMPAVTSLVLAAVPADRAGTASAVFNTFRQVGGAVAIAVFGALIAAPAGFLPGLRLSFAIAAAVAAGAVLGALAIGRRPRPGASDALPPS
ncbi:MFS transporter [Sinomonas sp. RB5]